MIIKPMIRNNICMNAHPGGCELNVKQQIDYVRRNSPVPAPQRVLVIGASAGYGLSSRIAAAFGAGARTIGVSFETPAKGSRTASAGWYLDQAFRKEASAAGLEHKSIIGDAFSHQIKEETVQEIRSMMGQVDLVVYSLASGIRIDPDTGEMYRSTLKPIGRDYRALSLDSRTGEVAEATVPAATEEEIAQTVKVMGGEDWELWIRALQEGGVLAPGAVTVAYSYIGPKLTFPLYRDGTIGRAKDHLEETARRLDTVLRDSGGRAWVSVNKALVTRASSVIPAVPLYLALLYRIMKEKGIHEGTIEQCVRLFSEKLFAGEEPPVDSLGRIRIDDWEMRQDVQDEVERDWEKITAETLPRLGDVEGIKEDFLRIHGFGFPGIDYSADVDIQALTDDNGAG